jgi:hypothetical protein
MINLVHLGRDGPWITIGGGNEHGNFSADAIDAIYDNLESIVTAGYSGIIFDIEIANGEEDDLKIKF